MKKKLIILGLGIILLLFFGAVAIVNVINRNINTSNHTEIISKVESPNDEYVAILFSYSTTTTPYRLGVSILTKDIYNKVQESNKIDKYNLLFKEKYNVLLLTSIYNDEETYINWISNDKLEVKCKGLSNAELNKVEGQSIDRKILKYNQIDIEYNK